MKINNLYLKMFKARVSCVYRIQFIGGQFYIGSTVNLKTRLSGHFSNLKSKTKKFFYAKLKTTEVDYVEILIEIKDRKKLRRTEFLEIKKNLANPMCLNEPKKRRYEGKNLMQQIVLEKKEKLSG